MDHSHYPDSECLQLADSERPLPALPEPVSVSLEKESTTANLYGNDEKEFTEIREGFPRSLRMSTAKTSISTQRPTREPRICGLRKRIFWIMLGSLCLLVITAALASVIGVLSSKLSARARAAHSTQDASTAATSTASKPSWQTTLYQQSIVTIGTSTASPSAATLVATPCNATSSMSQCDQGDCDGLNDQDSKYGKCTAGRYNGCPCLSLCGPVLGPCNHCGGVSGTCQDDPYKGCGCTQ